MNPKLKREKKSRRKARQRVKISGTKSRPRLSVFRSNKHIYAQLIDDEKGVTLVVASDREIKKPKAQSSKLKVTLKESQKFSTEQATQKAKLKKLERVGKAAIAFEVGKLIAKKALDKKMEKVVFDRGGCAYHGRVKSLSEGAREGGLKF